MITTERVKAKYFITLPCNTFYLPRRMGMYKFNRKKKKPLKMLLIQLHYKIFCMNK